MLQVVFAVAAIVRLDEVLDERDMVTVGAEPSNVEYEPVEEAP